MTCPNNSGSFWFPKEPIIAYQNVPFATQSLVHGRPAGENHFFQPDLVASFIASWRRHSCSLTKRMWILPEVRIFAEFVSLEAILILGWDRTQGAQPALIAFSSVLIAVVKSPDKA